jgi:hypothetical protein
MMKDQYRLAYTLLRIIEGKRGHEFGLAVAQFMTCNPYARRYAIKSYIDSFKSVQSIPAKYRIRGYDDIPF